MGQLRELMLTSQVVGRGCDLRGAIASGGPQFLRVSRSLLMERVAASPGS